MKDIPSIFALVIGLCALAPIGVSAQTTVIADAFNRNGPIADSQPDVPDANFPGTWSSPGGAAAAWNTTTDGGGRLVFSGNASSFTRLPFAAQPGLVYTLSLTVNIAANPSDVWANFGFDDGATGEGAPAGLRGPWALVKATGAVECFANGTGTTIASLPAGTANRAGTNNLMQMVLDTTGANWSVRLLVNGDQRATHTFVGQPAIGAVVIGQYSGGTTLSVTNTGFALTAITPGLPEIGIQPQGFSNWVGKAALLSVAAAGAQPLYYQWLKGGDEIVGEVTDTLQFPSLTGENSGAYSVIVSNDLGAVTSQVAVAYVETGSVLQFSPSLALVQLPLTDTDAASGISSANLYLAALDFGPEETPIEIGGVPFQRINPTGLTEADGIDPVHGGSWAVATHSGIGAAPTTFSGEVGDASTQADPFGSVFLLLSDASLKSGGNVPLDHVTVELGGLTPGGKYSLRHYYRQRDLDVPRPITFTFNGHGTNESLRTDIDTGGAYYLRYDFTAEANSVLMTMTVNASGRSPVLYGLTLQQTEAPAVAPTIVTQPAGFTNWVERPGELSVSANGGLPLAYQWFLDGEKIEGATSAVLDFPSLAGTDSGEYQVVVTNITGAATSSVARVFVVTDGVMALTPSVSIRQLPAFDTDLATGINAENVYLAALDFGNDTTPLTINEVPFQQVSLAGVGQGTDGRNPLHSGVDATFGGTWSLAGSMTGAGNGLASHGAATTEADGATASLLADFTYLNVTASPGDTATLTLGSLVPGGEYLLRYYYRAWGTERPIQFTFDGHGTNEVVLTDLDTGGAYVLEYAFTAAAANVTVIGETILGNQGPHIYGVTLQQTAAPPVPPSIVTQPAGVTNWSGLNVLLSVGAEGALPLAYQWIKDGQPVEGATTAGLTLDGLAEADAGDYQVVVTNLSGSVTSSVARVGIVTGDVMTLTPTLAIRRLPAADSDAASGVAEGDAYLAALDFGSDTTPLSVNGVVFQQINVGGAGQGTATAPSHSGVDDTHGGSWRVTAQFTGAGNGFASHNAGTDQADGVLSSLLADFTYLGGTVLPGDTATLTLGGLTPGASYTLRHFYRRWDVNRPIRFTFDGHGTNEVVQTDIDLGGAYVMEYTFTAADEEVSVGFETRVAGNGPHIYGVTLARTGDAPETVTLLHTRDGNQLTLSWDTAVSGYVLESAGQLPAMNWEPVAGVVNNSVTVDVATGTRFYQLRRP